jgi:DNA-binding beta-propeller fold protein YncE
MHPQHVLLRIAAGSLAACACLVGAGGVRARSGQETGAVLYTAHLGTNPLAVAVDARTGRVFVANATGGSVSVLTAGP